MVDGAAWLMVHLVSKWPHMCDPYMCDVLHLQLSAQPLDADYIVNLTVYENASVKKRKMLKAF